MTREGHSPFVDGNVHGNIIRAKEPTGFRYNLRAMMSYSYYARDGSRTISRTHGRERVSVEALAKCRNMHRSRSMLHRVARVLGVIRYPCHVLQCHVRTTHTHVLSGEISFTS